MSAKRNKGGEQKSKRYRGKGANPKATKQGRTSQNRRGKK